MTYKCEMCKCQCVIDTECQPNRCVKDLPLCNWVREENWLDYKFPITGSSIGYSYKGVWK